MLNACVDEGLIDGQLSSHNGVVGRGEDSLDTGGDEGFGRHLDFGGGGAVLLNVLDALCVAEGLCVSDGLRGGILAQVIQQADGVDVGVDGQNQVHDGVGVQGVGGTGDVRLSVETDGLRVGDGRVDDRDVGVFHSGQHGSGGRGSDSHDDVHAVGDEVCADLVQVGLVGLCVCVVVGVIEGDALLLAGLIQTALDGLDDLVQGSVVDVVDDADLKGLASLRSSCAGSGGAGCGRRCRAAGSGTAASGQAQCGDGCGCDSSFQEAAARDHVHGFHSGTPFPGVGGKIKRTHSTCGTGSLNNKTPRPCVFIHKDRIGKIRFCGATLLALL